MNRGRRGEAVFFDKEDYQAFIQVLIESTEMWNLRVAAYCLMSNHYHLVIETPDGNLSKGMRQKVMIVAALLILLVGAALGRFAGAAVTRSAEAGGLEFGPSLGRALSGAVVFISVIMAITQLRIDTDIVRLVTAGSLAGVALAFGLSFGIGSRAVVRNILAGFYVRRLFAPGTEVEVEGRRGTVSAVSTTSTVIDLDDGADGPVVSAELPRLHDEVAVGGIVARELERVGA